MVDKICNELKSDDQFQGVLDKWQSRFLFRRQAPQEILKPNEEIDDGFDQEDDQGEMP